jgi:hypothetical protein
VLYVETETVLHEGAQTHLIVDLSNHRVPAPDVAWSECDASAMQFQIWPLKMEAARGKSQRKFGGVHAIEWLPVAQSGVEVRM